jgi:hypothetical protein
MTQAELKALSDSTFFDNNTGEIEPSEHRAFNNQLIDSIYNQFTLVKPQIDYASAIEQFTGDFYNGKKIYMKVYSLANLAANTSPMPIDLGMFIPSSANMRWIDYNNTFGFDNQNEGNIVYATAIATAVNAGLFAVYLYGNSLSFTGTTAITYNIKVVIKYTKS